MLYKKEVMEDNKKLKEENKALKILCNKYEKEHKTTFEEWKKTINIINELEKFVKNCNEYNSKCNSTIYEGRAFEDSVILYKIKELKGSDKE